MSESTQGTEAREQWAEGSIGVRSDPHQGEWIPSRDIWSFWRILWRVSWICRWQCGRWALWRNIHPVAVVYLRQGSHEGDLGSLIGSDGCGVKGEGIKSRVKSTEWNWQRGEGSEGGGWGTRALVKNCTVNKARWWGQFGNLQLAASSLSYPTINTMEESSFWPSLPRIIEKCRGESARSLLLSVAAQSHQPICSGRASALQSPAGSSRKVS